jgi:4-nitrophenyl phosphatase
MTLITPIHAVLFDIDGVLLRGARVLPGAKELLAFLTQQDIPFVCLSNNSTLTPSQYADKLKRAGLSVAPEQIITAALATRAYMEQQYAVGTSVFAIGMEGVFEALFGDGYFRFEARAPQVVVVGHDTLLSYEKCVSAVHALHAGAALIATNPDKTIPVEDSILPETGALLAYLCAATDAQPTIVGKPASSMFQTALMRLGVTHDHVLMVGDRLDTDLAGAHALGIRTALMLTGVTNAEQARQHSLQPHVIFPHLSALTVWLRNTNTLPHYPG